MITPLLLDTTRVRMHGNSYVVTLTKRVRQVLGVKLGDFVSFRKYGRFLVLAVIPARVVSPGVKTEVERNSAAVGA